MTDLDSIEGGIQMSAKRIEMGWYKKSVDNADEIGKGDKSIALII